MNDTLTVLVLGGGPDRERDVSLVSAAAVAAALRSGGYQVIESDIGPGNESALDGKFDVVFPVLHGKWGEGGALQRIMEMRKLKFVGCGSRAASTAMDKYASKQVAEKSGVPTAPYQLLGPSTPIALDAPMVIKALTEGSSFGMAICPTLEEAVAARKEMVSHFAFQMAEKYIAGRELTVGIVDDKVLPPIQIVPKAKFYDYHAKYKANDTDYLFDIDLPPEVIESIKGYAMTMHRAIGCRHLSRVDFMVDADARPWFLEINTMPGFTDHSLVPMAARRSGMEMGALCDRLVRLAREG